MSSVSVEVVGQAAVRGAGGHDEPGEAGGHDGVVGEPPEGPVRGGRGELGPGCQRGRCGVEVGSGKHGVGVGQCGAAHPGVIGWSEAPSGAAVAGPLLRLVGEVRGPVCEVGGAGLAGEVEQEGGQESQIGQVCRWGGGLSEDGVVATVKGGVDAPLRRHDGVVAMVVRSSWHWCVGPSPSGFPHTGLAPTRRRCECRWSRNGLLQAGHSATSNIPWRVYVVTVRSRHAVCQAPVSARQAGQVWVPWAGIQPRAATCR